MNFLILAALVAFASARPSSDRIVNGVNAGISDYPWQVSLQKANNHFCGGSILNTNHILTAAHCYSSPGLVTVVAGITNLQDIGIQKSCSSFTTDPNYNSNSNNHDYAVIKTKSAFSFSNTIDNIALAEDSHTNYADGQSLITTGWGCTGAFLGSCTSRTNLLQVATVAYVKDCSKYWSGITSYKMCAGGNGVSSCMGDSGGPLVLKTPVSEQLVGAVSYGSSSCNIDTPAVYAAVYENRNWIKQQMNL